MYNAAVLDRFHNPKHSGAMEDATHHGMGGLRGEGPYLELWLHLAGGKVEKASFETYGCPAAVACGSILCELLPGRSIATARSIEAKDLMLLLGGLPDGKGHCADLAVAALRSALEES